MTIKSLVYTVLLSGLLLPFLSNCKKEAGMATVVTDASVTNITAISAKCSSEITSDGGSSVTDMGVCWSTSRKPTLTDPHTNDGAGVGSFTSRLTGLKANTVYYLRGYVINNLGIVYGNEVSFRTNESGETITDIDGNVYYTVTIGTQVWMVENLKTTKYRNGDTIPNITDAKVWRSLTSGAYCNYNNFEGNSDTYGRLYNRYAVNDSRNIAPVGWHVANDEDWSTLITYMGGESIAGDELKETGSTHWFRQGTGTTNETGFTALPGGCRLNTGDFDKSLYIGNWWSSKADGTSDASFWSMYDIYSDVKVFYGCNKGTGFSVRCLRD